MKVGKKMKKKTFDKYFTSKYHEDDLFQVNVDSQTVSISQLNDDKTTSKVFLTFDAIEELHQELQKHKQ